MDRPFPRVASGRTRHCRGVYGCGLGPRRRRSGDRRLDELYPGVEELLQSVDYLITSRDIPGRLMEEPDLRKSLPALHQRLAPASPPPR